ncbi:shell fibrous prismatic perlucin-like protein 1 [Plakobranchus ocellatus]|uniref:Shell fibrous prismatic perlucin-like protein 1 n=1 Tax=Plakobranchus ocellatus TaxID=259542 RepID=A0AAV3ZQ85_9GAST|nr:shell fibrous prismatic perlucin-like protein 1 [Plakobranchus ocellatus]
MNGRCKQRGGYLVQFDDNAEQKHVANLLFSVPGNGPFFTGLTDEESEGRFYTNNDKKPAKYRKFRWFQPDNWWNEACIEIWLSGLNEEEDPFRTSQAYPAHFLCNLVEI